MQNSRGFCTFQRSNKCTKKRFLYILLFIMYIITSKMDIIAENSPDLQKMVMSVVNQRQNQNSRQTYYTALTKFFNWYSAGDNQGITAEIIREYLLYLENSGKSKSTISTSLSVLRQLFKDLRRLEVIDEKIYNDLLEIKFKRQIGQRHKTWLEQEEVQKLLNNLNSEKMSIVRDRALIAVMTGCGLRRFEISDLKITQMKQVQGRWAFTDIKGKGERYRTVAIPEYAMKCLEEWLDISKTVGKTDRIFFSIRKNGEIGNTMITPQGIRDIVAKHSKNILDKQILPHDLRRTYAQLSYKAGAPLRQVQLSLGHSSIRTTEIYLGLDQDLTNAPGDYLDINV